MDRRLTQPRRAAHPPVANFSREAVVDFWSNMDDSRRETLTTITDEYVSKYLFDSLFALARSGFVNISYQSATSVTAPKTRRSTITPITIYELTPPTMPNTGTQAPIYSSKLSALHELVSSLVFVTRRSQSAASSSPLLSQKKTVVPPGANRFKADRGGDAILKQAFIQGSKVADTHWDFIVKIKPEAVSNFLEKAAKFNPIMFGGPRIIPSRNQFAEYFLSFLGCLDQFPHNMLMLSPLEPLMRGVLALLEFQLLKAYQKYPILPASLNMTRATSTEETAVSLTNYTQGTPQKVKEDIGEAFKDEHLAVSTRSPSENAFSKSEKLLAPMMVPSVDEEMIMYFNNDDLAEPLNAPPSKETSNVPDEEIQNNQSEEVFFSFENEMDPFVSVHVVEQVVDLPEVKMEEDPDEIMLGELAGEFHTRLRSYQNIMLYT